MPNASKTRQGIAFENVPGNRERFAILALMYGVAGVFSDHQFFYEDGTNLVLSFDHGHFFPGGPNWTIATLAACADAVPDPTIAARCSLTVEEIRAAAKMVVRLSTDKIAHSVASPVNSWGLAIDERIALAEHLEKRRNKLST